MTFGNDRSQLGKGFADFVGEHCRNRIFRRKVSGVNKRQTE